MVLMNTRHALCVTTRVCKSIDQLLLSRDLNCVLPVFSELAQKTQAEREAKRALHEAGVNKKKEIMARSVVLQTERQVIDSILLNERAERRTIFRANWTTWNVN